MHIRCPATGTFAEVPLDHDRVPAAIGELVDLLQPELWGAIHPLIRAAFAHIELVKIHPYIDGNGRLARMLLQAVLIEEGWPLLPWETLFQQRRATYVASTDQSISTGSLAPFIEFMLEVCGQAVRQGFRMAVEMKRERPRLVEALVGNAMTPRRAQVLADWALTHILTPDGRPSWVNGVPLEDEGDLGTTGLVDEICYEGCVCWSSPVARELVATRRS